MSLYVRRKKIWDDLKNSEGDILWGASGGQ